MPTNYLCLALSSKSKKKLHQIYEEINEKLGIDILNTDKKMEPHISLFLMTPNDKNTALINEAMKHIANNTKKINLKIEGIGIFKIDSRKYNLHFNISYTSQMQEMHKKIWNNIEDKVEVKQYNNYHPSSFTPHISIPIVKTTQNKCILLQVLSQLLKYNLKEIVLDFDYLLYMQGSIKDPQVFLRHKLK